jgi:histone-lysine N-methyltransferase SUV39H
MITNEEAEERGNVYDAVGCTYLFDLDYYDGEHHPYTIDSAAYGKNFIFYKSFM